MYDENASVFEAGMGRHPKKQAAVCAVYSDWKLDGNDVLCFELSR